MNYHWSRNCRRFDLSHHSAMFSHHQNSKFTYVFLVKSVSET